MAIIRDFVAMSTAERDILPPKLARSINNILKTYEKSYDKTTFLEGLDVFNTHTSNVDNPHEETILSSTYDELYEIIYNAYAKDVINPMMLGAFIVICKTQPLTFIEMLRRFVLNYYAGETIHKLDDVFKESFLEVPYLYASVLSAVPFTRESRESWYYGDFTFDGGASYPQGSILLHLSFVGTPTLDQPIFELKNDTSYIRVIQCAHTGYISIYATGTTESLIDIPINSKALSLCIIYDPTGIQVYTYQNDVTTDETVFNYTLPEDPYTKCRVGIPMEESYTKSTLRALILLSKPITKDLFLESLSNEGIL